MTYSTDMSGGFCETPTCLPAPGPAGQAQMAIIWDQKGRDWSHLTWISKVPWDSHHWLLLLLGDHPVEEKLPQIAQETSSPKTSSKSLPLSPSPELNTVTSKDWS